MELQLSTLGPEVDAPFRVTVSFASRLPLYPSDVPPLQLKP
jgi:hypothetical protein